MAGPASAGTETQTRLIRSLSQPAVYGPSCTRVEVLETLISFVLLTGRYAYKIKKAVKLGFLDFTTLDARHFYCDRELELNRRFAPAIYLDVVAITGTPDTPHIGGGGPAIEYAVKMSEFPQDGLLTRVLERRELTARHVDALAATVAAFHEAAAKAHTDSRFGSADEILDLAMENFTEIEPVLEDQSDRRLVAILRRWTTQEYARRAGLFTERQRGGFVRECHGDLHLGNIALVNRKITIFDCIEFNDDLRWSDVMADVAFLVMDLEDRKRPDLAARFLNAYLELTGDYDGVRIVRFYVVYRAMVRAKVACMRARQTPAREDCATKIAEYRDYLTLATRCTESTKRGIVVLRGPSGSGKTTQSQALVELAGAIRIRTDVERKRLHKLSPQSRTVAPLNAGLYSMEETERTYSSVAGLTRAVVSAGYPVVVDGTFLQRRQRDEFRVLATEFSVPFVIVDFVAPYDTLRKRVQERLESGLDASDADLRVLDHQWRVAEPIAADEKAVTVTVDAEALERSRQIESWQTVLDRLRRRAVRSASCSSAPRIRHAAIGARRKA